MGTLSSAFGGIVSSASKITFILLTLAACTAFLIGRLEAKDFMLLAISAYSFYYSNKGSSEEVTHQTTTKEDGTVSVVTVTTPPYLGK